jgi:hypothetical protein
MRLLALEHRGQHAGLQGDGHLHEDVVDQLAARDDRQGHRLQLDHRIGRFLALAFLAALLLLLGRPAKAGLASRASEAVRKARRAMGEGRVMPVA